jgi:alanine dehydrogenase
MLFLNKKDTEKLVSMDETIEAVENAFLKHSKGKTVYPPKDQFMLPTDEWKWWGFMPVYVEDMGVACKIVCDYPENPKKRNLPSIIATIVLADPETGKVKAIMDGTLLTAVRTGALGAIAAKYLSREDSKTAGIIGCGVQARTQLGGLSKVRKLEKVLISDLSEENMDAFIKDMSFLNLNIEKSNLEGVQECDIIIAATGSSKPVVTDVKEGTHITSIGAHTPDARELAESLVTKSKIVIDTPDCFKSGDLKDISKDKVTEIQEVIAGKKVRESSKDITIFKSVGTALQDVAIANMIFEKAKKEGVGQEIDF